MSGLNVQAIRARSDAVTTGPRPMWPSSAVVAYDSACHDRRALLDEVARLTAVVERVEALATDYEGRPQPQSWGHQWEDVAAWEARQGSAEDIRAALDGATS